MNYFTPSINDNRNIVDKVQTTGIIILAFYISALSNTGSYYDIMMLSALLGCYRLYSALTALIHPPIHLFILYQAVRPIRT